MGGPRRGRHGRAFHPGRERTSAASTARSGDEIVDETVTPEQAGLPRVDNLDELRGGTAEDNARTLVGILSGEIGGARRDLVLLNAAAGFVVAGLADDLAPGVERARAAIDSGRAVRVLENAKDLATD